MAPPQLKIRELTTDIQYFTGFYNESVECSNKLNEDAAHCSAVFRLEDCLLRLYSKDENEADDKGPDKKEPVEVFDMGVAELIVKPLPGNLTQLAANKRDRDYMRLLTVTNVPGQGAKNIIFVFPTGRSCKDWVHKVRAAQTNIGLREINSGTERRVSVDSHYCTDLTNIASKLGVDAFQVIKSKTEALKSQLEEKEREYEMIHADLSGQTSQCESRNEQIKLKENDIQHVKNQILTAQPQKKYKYIIPHGHSNSENDATCGARRGSVSVETCQKLTRERAASRLKDWMRFDGKREVDVRSHKLMEIARKENKKIEALTVDNGRHTPFVNSSTQRKMLENPKKLYPSAPYPDNDNQPKETPYEMARHTVKVHRTGSVSEVLDLLEPHRGICFLTLSTIQIYKDIDENTNLNSRSREAFSEQSNPNEMLKLLRHFEHPLVEDPNNEGKPKPALRWGGSVDYAMLGACIASIAEQVQRVLVAEPRLLKIASPTYTLGGFHGNFSDLIAFEKLLWRLGVTCTPSNFLFLGDYVDGGENGLEVVAYLFAQKLIAPQKFFLIRGQHEMRNFQELSTFKKECISKLGQVTGQIVWKAINKAFDAMPLAAVIDNKIFCVHGGIPSPYHKGGHLREFYDIPHDLPDPSKTSQFAMEVMLSEPLRPQDEQDADIKKVLKESDGFLRNDKNGDGTHYFSRHALECFLNRNDLTHVIRAGQLTQAEAGFKVQHNSRLLTVFSSSGYQDGANQAACVLADQKKIRVFRIDKDSLEKGPITVDNGNNANSLIKMPKDTGPGATKSLVPHGSAYELAMHTVNVQRSGSIKDVAVLWGSDKFYNPKLMSLSSAQVCGLSDEARKQKRSVSVENFDKHSKPNEMMHLLRYFEQPLVDPKQPENSKEAFSWGSTDPTHLASCIMSLCGKVHKIFMSEPRLLQMSNTTYILGDLHGNYKDLVAFEKLLWRMGLSLTPSDFLFLGDYVDRGPHGLEVVAYLFAQKIISPHKVVLLRGNHEDRYVQECFSFKNECKAKFGDTLGRKVWEVINKCFDVMPLAAVIDEKLFCVHGGIPSTKHDGGYIREINNLPKTIRDPRTVSLAFELLWSDPKFRGDKSTPEELKEAKENDGFMSNPKRGEGCHLFSNRALEQFLERNGLTHIIRAHQVKKSGAQLQLSGKLLTVFSSSDYQGLSNQAACVLAADHKIRFIRIDKEDLGEDTLKC